MSRWKTFEYWKDENCLLVGEVRDKSEDFDHEFGRSTETGLEFGTFTVFVYISGIAYDITSALSIKELDAFVATFQAKAVEKLVANGAA